MYEPLLTSRVYDPGLRTPGTKAGLLAGMGMTEKQGGSDVRANTTRAVDAGDGTWRITGHKWFTSAPMCDLFLVLAQGRTPAARACPASWSPACCPTAPATPSGSSGSRTSSATAPTPAREPEFADTVGWLVGEVGRGVRTIIEMVAMTRLDCTIGSASLMRAAVAQAIHHAQHRSAFGARLVDQPAMTAVLADLALESEAATTLMMRLAGSVDRSIRGDAAEKAFGRLATPVAKYWVTKRAVPMAGEALECLGGNGYVEESGMPRLFRESPLNSIWEGSGNVQALDVLRVLAKEPDAVQAFLAEVQLAAGADARLDAALTRVSAELTRPEDLQARARRIVEQLALVLQGSLLVRHAPAAVADAFCASRLGGDWGHAFGTLPAGTDARAIVARAAPVTV